MEYEKVWSGRLESTAAGVGIKHYTSPQSGGRKYKVQQVMVKVLAGSTNAYITADIEHGPDGAAWVAHTNAAINNLPATASLPAVLAGDSTSTVILGEFTRIGLIVKDGVGSTIQWANVEVWSMRKPF